MIAPGTGEIFERLLHLVGIVGQLVDLRLVEHGGERVSTRIAGRARAGRAPPAPFRRTSRSSA
jgi:hypothetical protein